jgi:hypothetical protein
VVAKQRMESNFFKFVFKTKGGVKKIMEFAYVVPIITALVQSLKMSVMPSRFASLVSILLGVAYSAFSNTSFNFDVVLFGIVIGLAASGTYDVSKVGVDQIKKLRK